MIRLELLTIAGAAGGLLSAALGGWNAALQALLVFMAIDYAMGLVVAGVFHRSGKTSDGRLESRAGWKGLVRKGVQLLIVLVGAQLDTLIGTSFVRDSIITAFCANELLSILENAGLMGIPIPPALAQAVSVLRQKSGGQGQQNGGEKDKTAMQESDGEADGGGE